MSKKVKPDREDLERLYVIEKKSTHEMSKILGVSQETARQWLIKDGIPLRTVIESLMTNTKKPSKEWLDDAYSLKGKTAKMIADERGSATITVYGWLKGYGIPRREGYESVLRNGGKCFGGKYGGREKMDPPSREDLYEAYVTQRKSAPSIAKIYGVSESTVRLWLTGYGIEIRTQTEAHKVNGKHLDKEWLIDQYSVQKKSTVTLEKETGVSKKTYLRTLKQFGIPIRTTSQALRNNPKRSGENNPMWKGGLSSQSKIIRASAECLEACRNVRSRDKGCLLCISKGIDPKGKNHEVHHIDPIASAPLLVFDVGNMILLCEDCHLSIRGKEKQWRKRLFNLIQKPE